MAQADSAFTTRRRDLLTGAIAALALPTAAAVAAVIEGGSTATDPIFAAIEAHRRADEAYGRAALEQDEGEEGDERLDARMSEASLADDEARWDIGEVQPTTMAGCIALLTYVNGNFGFAEDDVARVVARLTEALSALFPEAVKS